MWKYLSKVQVLSHLLKYKYKYIALFLGKYLSKMQVPLKVLKYKYKYILTKQIAVTQLCHIYTLANFSI